MFVRGIRPQDWTQSQRNAAVLRERECSADMKLRTRDRDDTEKHRRTEKEYKK